MINRRFPVAMIIGLTCSLLAVSGTAQAVTRVVLEGQSIADVLAISSAGDSVLVGPGQFEEVGLIMPSGVVLAAMFNDPAQYPVLVSDDRSSILVCEDLDSSTRVERLVFRGSGLAGFQKHHRGGAVRTRNAPVEFTDCVFQDLKAVYGGAVYCGSGQAPIFQRCEFMGNEADASGGALSLVAGQGLLLDHCVFSGNITGGSASVLNLTLRGSATVTHCTLVGNGSAGTTDICVWESQLVEVENTIVATSAGRAFLADYSSTPAFQCSDLFDNLEGDWVGALADQVDQSGNISADPLFCGESGEESPWQLDDSSPCATSSQCGLIGALGIGCSSVSSNDPIGEDVLGNGALPLVTKLRGNHPNPFNPQTTLSFDVSQPGKVSLEIYDLAGRRVRTLQNGNLAAGKYDRIWNGRSDDGRVCAAGVYLSRLKTENVIDTQRLTLVK